MARTIGMRPERAAARLGTLTVAGAAACLMLAAAPAAAQTVTLAAGNDATSLDPAYDTAVFTRSFTSNIYDMLLWRSADGTLEPALAESWEFVDDTTLKLNLRRGVKFHNGQDFTADDLIFSARRYRDEANPKPILPYVADMFESVEKVDDHTVLMHLPTPSATILGELLRMPILPEAGFNEIGETEFGSNPIGTGPFKFVRWDKNEQIVLEAFEDHWRGRPAIDGFVMKPYPEDFARFAALRTGEVDIVSNLPPERVPAVEQDPNLKIATVTSTRQVHFGINTTIEPLDDVRVRRALNHAVDVQAIVDAILGGYGSPSPSVCGKTLWGYDPAIEPYGYDPEKARALLAEAGHPDGFTLQMLGPTARYMKDREVQEAVAGQLAEVGIRVEHVTPEWADFMDRIFTRGKYTDDLFPGIYLLGTGGETLDCGRTLYYRIHSGSDLDFYRTDKTALLDELIDRQRITLDEDERFEIMREIQRITHEDVPWIFLYDQEDIYGLTQRVVWQPRPDEFVWAYDIKVEED